MRIRVATSGDCERMGRGMKVVVDEDRWLATESSTTAEELAGRFQRAIEDGHFLFVLEDGEDLAGSLGMHPIQERGVLSLGMWILPGFRGQGGGQLLMEAALAARPAAIHRLELEVFPDNEAAVALYLSMGFDEEGIRRDHYRRRDGSLRSSLMMARLFI